MYNARNNKPKKIFKEDKWAMEHYKELQEKYPDEWVVIKDEKVAKHGKEIEKKITSIVFLLLRVLKSSKYG